VSEREPLAFTPEEEAEERAFIRKYGALAPFDPQQLADFMAGFPRPWWIVGGWSIEAYTFAHGTGAPREHEDVDLSILACDVPALRAHVGDDWHLWSNHGGTLRPLDDRFPEPISNESQIWVRRSAQDPWVIDLPITPDRDGLWTSKRWPEHVAPVEEVTWVADTGIRYLNPEVTLHFKARSCRPKDTRDLERAWPLLDAARRDWLREAVRRTEPGSAWQPLLDAG
jgi:hypothetical protein